VNRRLFLGTAFAGTLSLSQALHAKPRTIQETLYERGVDEEGMEKTSLFAETHDDVIFRGENFRTLRSVRNRLRRVQSYVGYGNFNIISFDQALYLARNYSKIGAFTPKELDFMEMLFYTDAERYGFFGEKVLFKLTESIHQKETYKVPYTGHYLYRGSAQRMYAKIKKDLGKSLVLTSGVRSVTKQLYLFTNKAVATKGNLSIASRSLAPAGYSFHGIGDFDVGKVGYGHRNFTDDFAGTDEFKRLMDLGYINIRYFQNNPYGVRFEPWHIQVV